MNSRFDNFFRIFFAFTDLGFLCVLHLILLLSFNFETNAANISHVVFFILNNIFWLISSYFTEVYINDKILNFKKFARRTSRAFIIYLVFLLVYLFFSRYNFNTQYLITSFSVFLVYLIISRAVFLQISKYIGKKKRSVNKLIILGHNSFSRDVCLQLAKANRTVTILGAFDDDDSFKSDGNFPLLGTIADCIKYAVKHQVTEIYSTLSPEKYPEIYDIAQSAENLCIRFRFVPDLKNIVNKDIYFDYVDDIPVFSLKTKIA